MQGTVVRRRFAGATDLLVVKVDDQEIEVLAAPEHAVVGDTIRLAPTGVGAHAFEVPSP